MQPLAVASRHGVSCGGNGRGIKLPAQESLTSTQCVSSSTARTPRLSWSVRLRNWSFVRRVEVLDCAQTKDTCEDRSASPAFYDSSTISLLQLQRRYPMKSLAMSCLASPTLSQRKADENTAS